MEDKWCPENDGAYRMEMASIHRDSVDQQLHRARAEITQLRAELAAERELADRLAGALDYIDDYCLAYPELESLSAVAASAIEYAETRRNK